MIIISCLCSQGLKSS